MLLRCLSLLTFAVASFAEPPPVTIKGPAKWVQCLAFSPDGNRVVAGNDEGRLWVVEARTGKTVLECRDVLTAPTAVAWSPDGKHLAMGGWVGLVTVRDAQTGALMAKPSWKDGKRQLTEKNLPSPSRDRQCLAFSPDGSRVVAGNDEGRLWVVQTRWRAHRENVTSIVFSADNQYLATGSGDDTAKVWSVKGGEPLLTLEQGDEYDVTGVAFSPDGHQLLTGDGENRVKLWDTRTGETHRVLGAHAEAVSAVDWSADGKWVVSGGWDDVLKIWNTETGQARTLRGHTDDLTVLALSAKGERMVSASDDRTVRVWDLRTGKLRQTLRGHTAAVISLAISPDGRRAVSGSKNELKFWELK